jgi:predicted metal-dependent hydrolase
VPKLGVEHNGYREGIKLFNSEAFFEAHEMLEDVWRTAPKEHKKFLQGLIQVAVAMHHHSRGNVIGAQSLLARASRNLSGYPAEFHGIRLSTFLRSLADWHRALAEGRPVPPLPKM